MQCRLRSRPHVAARVRLLLMCCSCPHCTSRDTGVCACELCTCAYHLNLVRCALRGCSPWCFVGKRRLDSAIKHAQRELGLVTPVHVQWSPWLLRPRLAVDKTKAVDKKESYTRWLGSAERFDGMVRAITAIGREDDVGITFESAPL